VNTFILKFFFSGLLAFIPNQDGTELTVLFLNVDHQHQLSDGSTLAHHLPLLIARAGDCSGTCPKNDATIAGHLFDGMSEAAAIDALEAAVAGGGAWIVDGDLSIRKTSSSDPDLPALNIRRNLRSGIIPDDSTEREDYSWLAKLSQIAPSGYALNSDVFDTPPPSIVAARLTLRSGKVFTYRVARIGSDVTPVHFQRLDGTGSIPSYSQAVATWMGAEIEVSADDVQIVEEKFDGSTGRTMTLSPDSNGIVEVAVINLPPLAPPSTPFSGTPGAGTHFEAYYDLAATPPAQSDRLVPKPGAAPGAPSYSQVSWDSIHPQSALWSDLLNALRLNIGRTAYEQLLCPPTDPSVP
jgi:hypothetical protein